ncbi:YccF domain-containing protein [Micromonospora sp. NPDC049102]|uniref:YccF domain-containing protein n=1 Tax=Micromonospora sp. NPDC049102 TaxID=3364265 RepID=UPI003711E65A
MIRFVLNVLWLVFGGGLVLAIGYGFAALICFLLVVTIPFGVAALRLAVYSLWPFGRTLVPKPGAGRPATTRLISRRSRRTERSEGPSAPADDPQPGTGTDWTNQSSVPRASDSTSSWSRTTIGTSGPSA